MHQCTEPYHTTILSWLLYSPSTSDLSEDRIIQLFDDTQAIFVGDLVFPNNFKQIITCLGVGLLGYGAQITLTHGLRSAKAAPAIATSYLSVVWGILASLFIFHEVGFYACCAHSTAHIQHKI